MPLAVRCVEPQRTTSMPLLEVVKENRLHAVNVHNLTNVIRQLSSLATHAESVMGDIVDELAVCHQRATVLEERTRRLKDEVLPYLDPEQEGEKMCNGSYLVQLLECCCYCEQAVKTVSVKTFWCCVFIAL